jgi:N-methylhydantoinase A
MYRIGVDIGGTFTDLALVDVGTGETRLHKRLTTPDDPADGVIAGTSELADASGVGLGQIEAIVHGTTLVTNALIQRRGSRTGIIVTRGMRDRFEIARETRYDLFDLRLEFPEPLVPRALRREVDERINAAGDVCVALQPDDVRRVARDLVQNEQVAGIAVCFLNSYVNAAHEEEAVALIKAEHPEIAVSASATVFPYAREYERWTTAVMNVYVQPVVAAYIERIEKELASSGFRGGFHVMTSSGGMVAPEVARRFPIRLLESGPAAGVLMSAHHGRTLKLNNILSFDMGGTTAKGALLRGGQPMKRYELEVARVHEFKRGSGLPAKTPVLDMIEIGAGGGSIASVDALGVIRVGPESAGAQPGPACYGQGGNRPTLTDANLVLGYLDANNFLGGDLALDRDRAVAAIEEHVAVPLCIDLLRSAWGIHETINESVASAFRVHASERGFDYRTASLVAFGGSGPVHACRIARKLRIPRVILPPGAGVMSALGLLQSPFSFELARTRRLPLSDLTEENYASGFAPLEEGVRSVLSEASISIADTVLRRRLDIRFEGQGYEIETETGDTPDGLADRFLDGYRAVFSAVPANEKMEIVNWKIEGAGPPPLRGLDFVLNHDAAVKGPARKGSRPAYHQETGLTDVTVYDRYGLAPGQAVVGPAAVEERESTFILGPGDTGVIDPRGNLIVTIAYEGDPR